MSTALQTTWRIAGEEVASCNCDWGCPCQFNAVATTGRCEALLAWEVREGHYGDTSLEGVRFARIYSWPGPIHEGNGTRLTIVDEGATAEQREAIEALDSGTAGGAYFEIFAAVCPNRLETMTAPITVSVDREQRLASFDIPGLAETHIEPIKNPVTGADHRAKIVLPEGFEYTEAEVANTTRARVDAGGMSFSLENTYAQLNAFDWSNS